MTPKSYKQFTKFSFYFKDENLDDDPVVDISLDRDEEDEFTHIGKSVSFKGKTIDGTKYCRTDKGAFFNRLCLRFF